MANHAELLHATLARWSSDQHYPDPADHRTAVRHLDAIEELLGQMDDVGLKTDVFRRHFIKWSTLTLRHPNDWGTQTAQKLTDTAALEHLENLAEWFRTLVPTVMGDGLDQIRRYVDGVRDLLDVDDSLDPLLKQHAKQVIAHLIWCVDNYDAVGDFDLQAAMERLIATMVRSAGASDKRDRWRDLLNGFVYPFGTQVAAAIPAQALIQLALGGG